MARQPRSHAAEENCRLKPRCSAMESGPAPAAAFRGTSTPRTHGALTIACLAIIVLAGVVAFEPGLDNEFVYWDDDNNLMFNSYIREFSAENLRWMWTTSHLAVWQPLTWMIIAAEYQLFGGSDLAEFSRGMHLASLVLHSVAAVLVFFVARLLLVLGAPQKAANAPVGLTLGAAAAALLFVAHPLRAETVSWASGQPYILALIPALGAVWCYLLAQRTGWWGWQVTALACFGVSVLCKAMAVPLVGVLLVLDVYPLRRLGGSAGWDRRVIRRVVLEKLPYVALTLITVGMAVWATHATYDYKPEPWSAKLLVAGYCMCLYAGMTFVPYRIAPYYQRPLPFDSSDPWFIGATLVFVAVTVLLVLRRRRWPWALATWVVYVLVLLPVVGLIKHGGQMAADRYTYLSCIGWAVLVGAAVMRLWAHPPSGARAALRGVTLAVVAVAVIALGARSRSYCQVWKDSVSLWSAMVERNPAFHMGYYNLAKARKRPCADLIKRAREALDSGDAELAEELFQQAIKRFQAAERDYRKAIELYPLYPEANVDLGNMIRNHQARGGPKAALECYRTALRARPDFYMAHWNLGTLLTELKRYDEAVRHLEIAVAEAETAGDEKRLPSIRKALARAKAGGS